MALTYEQIDRITNSPRSKEARRVMAEAQALIDESNRKLADRLMKIWLERRKDGTTK